MKVIDAAQKNIFAEHEIRNISCAAQDPKDLCTFAYITKDRRPTPLLPGVHTVDVNLTYEIIPDLGKGI